MPQSLQACIAGMPGTLSMKIQANAPLRLNPGTFDNGDT